MHVQKRNGTLEPVNLEKITNSLKRVCAGLNVDVTKIAIKTIGGLFDGATTRQVDELSIDKAVWLIGEDPDNSKAAARILSNVIAKDVANQEIQSFSQSVAVGTKHGLFSPELNAFVKKNARKLNAAIKLERDEGYEYFGLKVVFDRYLAKHPETREIIEVPQYWLMRVAAGILAKRPGIEVADIIEFYDVLSKRFYMTSTPTLFNSGTLRPQMSSCYLLSSPDDDLFDIYKKLQDVALLSKFAGGIGLDYTLVRGEGALIKGTNGESNGVVPFIHTQDSSVVAVNQGGKRKGAAAVYLESWHTDIESFLDLRKNTGDAMKRAYNLNTANWVPDLLMKRVKDGGKWSLFSPHVAEVKRLTEIYDETGFEEAYVALEAKYEAMEKKPKWFKQVSAPVLFHKMMTTLAETGNGWMNFKDAANRTANQVTLSNGRIVRISNLCTEILEVVSKDETAVCNLGSIVLPMYVKADGSMNWEELARVVRIAMIGLDSVVDENYYPIPETANSNQQWRPVGLGIMGTHDMFHLMGLSFDDPEAEKVVEDVQAFIYYHALKASVEMAKQFGPFPNFKETRLAQEGKFQFELWKQDTSPATTVGGLLDWEALRADIKQHGTRNSLCIAIAPTATIASIIGVYESIEPAISNVFARQTLSGDFMQVNSYLVRDLQKLGLWTEEMRKTIIAAEGSVQGIEIIPENLRRRYRTAWEYSMKTLINLAAKRGRFIDQSQSLNLYIENATIGKLSSMYVYAWEKGIKTTYYLRSRAATKIAKVTAVLPTQTKDYVEAVVAEVLKKEYTEEEVIACSLDDPEGCEACQ